MKTTKATVIILVLALGAACFTRQLMAQDSENHPASGQNSATESKAPQAQSEDKPLATYRVEFTLSEFVENKKTNSRSYSVLAKTHSWNKIRIGTRLPVLSAPNNTIPNMPPQFQYIDLGINIDCFIEEQDGMVLLNATVDVSGMAPERDEQTHAPIIRQMKTELRTVLAPGKPTIVNTNDDPLGKTRFQLEATVTKAK